MVRWRSLRDEVGWRRGSSLMQRVALLLLLGWSYSGPAAAEPRGLLVRFDPGGSAVSGPVKVVLTSAAGKVETLELKDDGNQPDVAAGDGNYSAAAAVDGDQFTVKLELNGAIQDAGAIAWKPEDDMRDLDIRVVGGTISAETGVASPGAQGGPSGGGAGAPSGGAPTSGGPSAGAPGAPTSGGSSAGPSSRSAPSESSTPRPLLFFGLGLGLLVVLGLLWWVARSRSAPAARTPSGMEPLPQPGLLGEGFPSLSDGLSLYQVGSDDEVALAQGMLRLLARTHRVVVVAPTSLELAPVPGGPVYRCTVHRPNQVATVLDGLQAVLGRPIVALVVGQGGKADLYRDLADLLPLHVGAVALVQAELSLELATVTCAADPTGWTFQMNGSPLLPAPDRYKLLSGDTR